MPKPKVRVPLNCLIAPSTLSGIVGLAKAEKISQGVVVDRAVSLLVHGALAENNLPHGQPDTEIADEMMRGVETYKAGMRMFKRGIRPKGDTKR